VDRLTAHDNRRWYEQCNLPKPDKAFFGNINGSGHRTVTIAPEGVQAEEFTVDNLLGNDYTIGGGGVIGEDDRLTKLAPDAS
jgi:hypothetical protein